MIGVEALAARLRESEILAPIRRQARGDGAWRLVTREGEDLGLIARETLTAPDGKHRIRRIFFGGELMHDLGTAIFCAAFASIGKGKQSIDQQIYLRFIEGARLVKEKDA